jgi:putative transposase
MKRDERWSEAIAVGSQAFVEKVKRDLGTWARHREVDETDGTCVLREPRGAYTSTFGTENSALRPGNATLWTENPANA